MFDLNGKTALVTGSSRGIGKAMLVGLARRGATVILHCRKPCTQADETLREITGFGGNCTAVYADFLEATAAENVYEQVKAEGLSVDILILNASVEIRREWTDITDAEYDLQMNINFRAPLKLAQCFVPDMKSRGWGRVITVGSLQQKHPHQAMMVYAASKAALSSMAISLATLLAPFGITVNNIGPGAVRTDRNAEALSDPKYAEKVRKLIPMEYIGCPDDIVGLVVYLASEESKYMTGQDIYIDGGKGL